MHQSHRKRRRGLTTIALVAAIIGLGWIWTSTAALRGTLAAKFDLARGHYAILAYGFPPGSREEYTRLLKERYGIERRQIALCIVSPSTIAYADSYNRLSVAAAQRKFGQDIFQQTWQDAQRMWLHQRFPRERIVSYLFSYMDKPADGHHEPLCLNSIKPGMKMEEVVERCGSPDEDRGSDKYEFVYRMPNGTMITITALSLLSIEQVTYQRQEHFEN